MTSALQSYLEAHDADARDLLVRLCRQPSVSAQHLGMGEMAALVEQLLAAAGFTTERFAVPDAPPIIFGERKGRSPYTLLLYNHYDVQPPEPFELWDSPPFEPTIRDGKLFAHGASDNKSEIAARLSAIHALLATEGDLPITLKWIIEGEEEVGSSHFEDIIAPHRQRLTADACLWEGAGFDVQGRPELGLGSKGLLYVQLDVQCLSRDAHSGGAPVLPSAAWRLVQALATLKDASGRITIPGFHDAVRPPSEAQIAALREQPVMDEEMKVTYGVERFVDGLTGHDLFVRQAFAPTCNIAGLESGYTGEGSKTVLPAKAMAKIDFRLVPDQEPGDILAKLRAHLDAQGYRDIQITTSETAEPVVTPLEAPIVRHIAAIAESFEGKRPSITPLSGGTLPLLGALKRQVGVPGLSAPGNATYYGNLMHSPNEHIRLADLARAVRFNCHMFAQLGA